MLKINEIVFKRYMVLECIGSGGMANVYKVKDIKLGKIWAIKELRIDVDNEAARSIFAKSILDEADLLKQLDHPGMPRVVDVFMENNEKIFMVMDYIQGNTLKNILEDQYYLKEEEAVNIIIELCDVLIYLHGQNPPIIYRDMKPDNIMIDDNKRIKLIDYGIARSYKDNSISDTIQLGTKDYAAPEQLKKEGQSDERTDIYSLGITFIALLTGTPNKTNINQKLKSKKISKNLINIIKKSIEIKPSDRYQSVDQLKDELKKYKEIDKKKLYKSYFAVGVFNLFRLFIVLFVVIGVIASYKDKELKKQDKDKYIQIINLSGNDEQKIQALKSLIELTSDNKEYYLWLVESYGSDKKFDLIEEAELIGIINNYGLKVLSEQDYAELCYYTGLLYWNYYSYAEGDMSLKAKTAKSWFMLAIQNGLNDQRKNKARLYSIIGSFYEKNEFGFEEKPREGEYLQMFQAVKELIKEMDNSQEVFEKESVYILADLMENMDQLFIDDGVSISELKALKDKLKKYGGKNVKTDDSAVCK